MARLPYLDREDLSEADREIFDDMMARFGRIHNLHRVIAHSPDMLRALIQWGEAIRRCARVEPKLRELAIVTVARTSQCHYEFVHHGGIALRVGVRQEQLEQLEAWEGNPIFTEEEQAVIRYAVEATLQVRVADATFDALRPFFDAEQIVQLVLIVAHFNLGMRLLLPLEIELESDAHESRYNLAYEENKP